VVPNFENIGTSACRSAPSFTGLAGVAHEQFAEDTRTIVIAQSRDDAVFVDVVTGIGEKWRRRRQDIEHNTIVRVPMHPSSDNNWNSMYAGAVHSIPVRASRVRLTRIENHSNRHRSMIGRAAPT
jgi:hypothetical protein